MKALETKIAEKELFDGIVDMNGLYSSSAVTQQDYTCDPCDGCSSSCGGCSSYTPNSPKPTRD